MHYTDVSLRSNKNLKLPSLKTERPQGIRKGPVFKGCVDRDQNWVRTCPVWKVD